MDSLYPMSYGKAVMNMNMTKAEKEAQKDILRMAYDNVSELNDTYLVAYSNGVTFIIDYAGHVVYESSANSSILIDKYDDFTVVYDKSNNKIACSLFSSKCSYNVNVPKVNRRTRHLWSSGSISAVQFNSIYLCLLLDETLMMYDNHLNLVLQIDDVYSVNTYTDYRENDVLLTKVIHDTYDNRNVHIVADKITHKILSYDRINLNQNMAVESNKEEVIIKAVEYTGKHYSNSSNSDAISVALGKALPGFGYVLEGRYGTRSKVYDSISKIRNTSSVISDNYFLSVNINDVRQTKVGLIRRSGEEVLEPCFDSIEPFSNDLFICKGDGKTEIFDTSASLEKPELLVSVDSRLVSQHATLPILIFVKDNKYMIFDNRKRCYEMTDIVKNFPCEYSLLNTNILRIDIGNNPDCPIYKYVDTRLNVINNLNILPRIKSGGWAKL